MIDDVELDDPRDQHEWLEGTPLVRALRRRVP